MKDILEDRILHGYKEDDITYEFKLARGSGKLPRINESNFKSYLNNLIEVFELVSLTDKEESV